MSTPQRPLVTVLMAVYNGGKYLRQSIGTVLAQTYANFEFLIVNDCSTDDTLEVIESFDDDRITVHNNEVNMGQTRSLNVGLRLARGKYVARMDADDMAFPEWIDTLAGYMESNPGYAVVGASAVALDASGNMKRHLRAPTSHKEAVIHTFFGNAVNHVGALLQRERVLENGGYDEEYRVVQDYELWSSLIRNGYRITNVPDVLTAVRVHDSSLGAMEEEKKGLSEVAETIYRNVNSLTNLEISHKEAINLRMFYRFPEQLTDDEFIDAHSLCSSALHSLRECHKLSPGLLDRKLKGLMLAPFSKKAVHDIQTKRLRAARSTTALFSRHYGFHPMQFIIYLSSYVGSSVAARLPRIYSRFREKTTRMASYSR